MRSRPSRYKSIEANQVCRPRERGDPSLQRRSFTADALPAEAWVPAFAGTTRVSVRDGRCVSEVDFHEVIGGERRADRDDEPAELHRIETLRKPRAEIAA